MADIGIHCPLWAHLDKCSPMQAACPVHGWRLSLNPPVHVQQWLGRAQHASQLLLQLLLSGLDRLTR